MGTAETPPSAGVRRYSEQVVAALAPATNADRTRLVEEVATRLVAHGVADYQAALERFGDPIGHADRVRGELGLPPAKPRNRFPKRLIAVVLLVGAAAGAILLARRDDAAPASVLSVSVLGETSGDTTIENGEVIVELHDGTDAEFAIVLVNTGDEPVEVERVLPLPHVESVGGELVVGGDGPPVVQVEARLAPPGADALRSAADFEDPLARPFVPTELAPGQRMAVLLQGTLVDCQLDVDDRVELPVQVAVEVDGEERIVTGPAVVFDAGSCGA